MAAMNGDGQRAFLQKLFQGHEVTVLVGRTKGGIGSPTSRELSPTSCVLSLDAR